MKNMQKATVAYPFNIYSWKYVLISIASLMENASIPCEVVLVHNEEIFQEAKNEFDKLVNKYEKLQIRYVDVKESLKPFEYLYLGGNILNLYPFVLPKLLPDVDKIIKLPSFSIVNDDIAELNNLSLDDYMFAGVNHPKIEDEWSKETGISKKEFLDFSILVIDCKKAREEKLYEEAIQFARNEYHYSTKHNQILYAVFLKDKWKKIPYKYNFHIFKYRKKHSKIIESLSEFNGKIINFSYEVKADFSTADKNLKEIWKKYADIIDYEYCEMQSYKLSTTSAQNSFKYAWLLSRIFPYIKPYWFRIFLGFAIAIPLGLLDGVTAFALKPYMDYVIGGQAFEYSWHGLNISISSLQMAWVIPIGVILFAAIQGVLRYLNGYFSSWVSARITNDVKFDLFERLIHMHPQFFDDNSSGIVISRYMSDPGAASAGIVDNIKTITTSLCGALGLIAVMIYSSWKLAFIGVIVLCVAFIPVILIRKRIKEASNKNMVIGGKITTNINETYSGNKVMTAYGLQERQNKYFQEKVWESYHIGMSLYKRAGWMSPMMYLIASFGIATVLGVGTYLINTGQMTAGAFASFVTSLLLLYKPVKTLGNTLTGIQNIFVAMGRVFELFDLTPAIVDCENPKEMKGFNSNITFENVVFEYIPNKPVLKNLNLSVKKNETLAIVGNSGGGKSTLVNLIPRFYDIKSGSIKFDGIDIKEFSLKSLRQNISMVFQDNFLYTGTIKENIMMGNPDASMDELMQAIKSAHLQDMVSELPEGLDTELGERGLTLSGGQRQRVAIARAMLRNAPIVILDEATSALDNESEAIVQKAMDNLVKEKTVFIIAHRLSTIKNADRIAVINEGELAELGTHEQLMQIENGQYKALYEMQFKKQEENAK
ncbi:MAG: ATP-binding cassette domain-containing protein [Candidatus Gastranaerophilales bacterium]|nr:ATP-binding cassette domain-containing protein [Candidatus Gastranaerophilales bacterium]